MGRQKNKVSDGALNTADIMKMQQRILKKLHQIDADYHTEKKRLDELHKILDHINFVQDRTLGRVLHLVKRLYRVVNRRLYTFDAAPLHSPLIDAADAAYTHDIPQFDLKPHLGRYPYGWGRFCLHMAHSDATNTCMQLYFDTGDGFSEGESAPLVLTPSMQQGAMEAVQFLPPDVRRLRLSAGAGSKSHLHITQVTIQELTKHEALLRLAMRQLLKSQLTRQQVRAYIKHMLHICKAAGIGHALHELQHKMAGNKQNYALWAARFNTLTSTDKYYMAGRIKQFAYHPVISVVMPVYNVDAVYLQRAIESVRQQLYPYWELCIADDASTKPHVQAMLAAYAADDSRIRVVSRNSNGHIAAASNSALALATGDFVALLDHDDELSEHALYLVVEEINAYPDVGLMYSDEDKYDAQHQPYDAYFKPDFNLELLRCQNYINHLSVYRRALINKVGGFREGYEGSQDYDLLLRVVEHITPNQIRHIPHVLYHWRAIEGSTALAHDKKSYAAQNFKKALQAHLQRCDVHAAVTTDAQTGWCHVRYALQNNNHKVSLIIPTRDKVNLLECCVSSILNKTSYDNFEVIIVDNQSKQSSTLKYFKSLQQDPRVRIIPYNKPFNYSALYNTVVPMSTGSVIGLLNNDIEVLNADWLEEMLGYVLRPDVGAVGAKLYYPDRSIQHAGVILGIGGIAGHGHKYISEQSPGYFGRAMLAQEISAVTGACLLVRRALYEAVGGLEEKLKVAFNDIDFCLRLLEKGFVNIWTPHARLVHYESASRGIDTTFEQKQRFLKEINYMKKRWGHVLYNDPAYNPNLTLEKENFSIAVPPRVKKTWLEKNVSLS